MLLYYKIFVTYVSMDNLKIKMATVLFVVPAVKLVLELKIIVLLVETIFI
jgi:hypothetical protein